jgi:predicted permease
MLSSDRGFDTSNVVAAEIYSHGHVYDKDPARLALVEGILNRLRTLPGAQSVALGSAMPLEGETWVESINRADKHVNHPPLSNARWVSADYFRLLRERLVAGRLIEERDRDSNVLVISESSAKAAWPGENPVGKQIRWRDKLFTVIGIVADSRTNSLKDTPVNMMYFGYRALAPFPMIFMIRTKQSPNEIIPDVRRAIWDQDPEITISRVKTLDSQVKDSLAPERFQTFILVAFGISALLLAMLGIYGVLSYIVAGRTQEFGVRMALGATRESIYSLTMSEAAMPVFAGFAAGWGASVLAARFVEKLLYGVTAVDWTVTLVVAMLFVASAAIAAFLPARRAAGIEPMQALRAE